VTALARSHALGYAWSHSSRAAYQVTRATPHASFASLAPKRPKIRTSVDLTPLPLTYNLDFQHRRAAVMTYILYDPHTHAKTQVHRSLGPKDRAETNEWTTCFYGGHSRSSKVTPFDSFGMVSYSTSIATMAVSRTRP